MFDAPAIKPAFRFRSPVFYFIFFCSGASALTFETLWFRQAGLVFGNSVWASSMVLASFMAGLALGNFFAGRKGHTSQQPIRTYGWLELLIGAFGLGLVIVFPNFNSLFAPLFEPFLESPWVLNPLRLGIGFLLLLPATMAMGATLPYMVRGLSAQQTQFGVRLGKLYALNTMGAMVGTLVCEMVLIERFGIQQTGCIAAGLNLFAGLVALVLGKIPKPSVVKTSSEPSAGASPAIETSNEPARKARLDSRQKRILVATFLAGGILLALEVVWFRFLLLLNFGTSHVFAVMLAVVLGGISIGGVIGARWVRKNEATHALSIVAVCSGLLTISCYAIPSFLIVRLDLQLKTDITGITTLGHSLIVMFPVAMLSGFLFTLMGTALHREGIPETETAGYLTLCNTTGAMFGAILGGFFLLPRLGLEKSFLMLGLGYVAVSAFCWQGWSQMSRPVRVATTALTMLLLGIGLGYPKNITDKALFVKIAGVKNNRNSRLVALREGITDTIMYTQMEWMNHPLYHRLITNSHSMSGTTPAAWQYMKMYVYLPVAVHPKPRKACLISYGCGVTGKALTDTKELEQIDVVDISRDVLELNRVVFPERDECPLSDPRVRIFIEDGRFFLQTTQAQYDLITSEPPPPKGANIVNLYTQEYFQLIHDRLAKGGMTSYWLPHHSLCEQDARTIVRAFCEVFEDCSLWIGSGDNWMLLGVKEGHQPVSEQRFRQQWLDRNVGPILAASGFESPEQMGSYFIGDRKFMMAWTEDTLPLQDNFPYRLSPHVSSKNQESRYAELLDAGRSRERFTTSDHIARLFPASIIEPSLPYFAHRNYVHDIWAARRFRFNPIRVGSIQGIHDLQVNSNLKTAVLWSLDSGYRDQLAVDKIIDEGKANVWVTEKLGHRYLADRVFDDAIKHYAKCLENLKTTQPEYQHDLIRHIYAQCMAGDRQAAQSFADQHLNSLDSDELRADWDYLKRAFELQDPAGKEFAKK